MSDNSADEWPGQSRNDAKLPDLKAIFGEVVHTYSRAQAIADGWLVEADPELTERLDYLVPIVYTRAVYEDCVAWAADDGPLQDQEGREWDLLFALRMWAMSAPDADWITLPLMRIPKGSRDARVEQVQLLASFGPGDSEEPVLTVMFPSER